MKRSFLLLTAVFFLCAIAIVVVSGHVFEPRASVPAATERIVEHTTVVPPLRLPRKVKALLPHFAP
ncbi:MAG: hypothetical protein J6K50_00555 [Clostridia bacterium]|nr:hypothetical protein [Clostridia bacterium]